MTVLLNLIMFADDMNLFHEHKNTKLVALNKELRNINDRFVANKLSLNVGKNEIFLFS